MFIFYFGIVAVYIISDVLPLDLFFSVLLLFQFEYVFVEVYL